MRRGNFAISSLWGRWAALLSCAAVLLCAPGLAPSAGAGEERTLSFYEIHTKETATITFKRDGEFLPEGLKRINHIMRDWRRDVETDMDPELIDLVWTLHRELGSKEPIHLISGFRSSKTNEKLRRSGGGQAKKSQHILGKAADIHFPDVSVKTLRNSALVREIGGVGYYPKSGVPFVHVDTGRVRHWPGISRMELAALFPDGHSQHVPSDGRPITLADYRRATENGRYPGPPPVMIAKADEPEKKAVVAVAVAAPSRKPYRPHVTTAGLAGDSLGAFMRAAGITGSIPVPDGPRPGDKGSAMMQLASADPSAEKIAAFPARRSASAPASALPPGDIADADEEHPEELAYQPFSVLPLMSGTSVSREADMVALVAPEFDNADYLLSQPEHRLALRMKPQVSIQHIASAWEFTGPAVRNLLPAAGAPRQPGRVMTASTPVRVPVPLGGPVGYSGGGTGLGFQ